MSRAEEKLQALEAILAGAEARTGPEAAALAALARGLIAELNADDWPSDDWPSDDVDLEEVVPPAAEPFHLGGVKVLPSGDEVEVEYGLVFEELWPNGRRRLHVKESDQVWLTFIYVPIDPASLAHEWSETITRYGPEDPRFVRRGTVIHIGHCMRCGFEYNQWPIPIEPCTGQNPINAPGNHSWHWLGNSPGEGLYPVSIQCEWCLLEAFSLPVPAVPCTGPRRLDEPLIARKSPDELVIEIGAHRAP